MAARGRLYALDGLRGVAALTVLLGHTCHVFGFPAVVPRFYLAVDFFFLLSGFIMARSYQDRIDAGGWRPFLVERAIRLWPLMILGAAFGAATLLASLPPRSVAIELAFALLCLPHFGALEVFALNVPRWSLFFEVVANTVHGLVGRQRGTLTLTAVTAAFGVVLVIRGVTGGGFDGGATASTLDVGFLRVGFSYTLGVLLYRSRLSLGRWPFAAAAAVLALVFCAPAKLGIWLDVVIVTFVWPLVLVACRDDWPGIGNKEKWVLAQLGLLSYPLYILHHPILDGFAGVRHRFHLPRTALVSLFIVSAIGTALGAAALYDRPARRWLERLRARSGVAAPKP